MYGYMFKHVWCRRWPVQSYVRTSMITCAGDHIHIIPCTDFYLYTSWCEAPHNSIKLVSARMYDIHAHDPMHNLTVCECPCFSPSRVSRWHRLFLAWSPPSAACVPCRRFLAAPWNKSWPLPAHCVSHGVDSATLCFFYVFTPSDAYAWTCACVYTHICM